MSPRKRLRTPGGVLDRFNVTRCSQNAAAIAGWHINPMQTPSVSASERGNFERPFFPSRECRSEIVDRSTQVRIRRISGLLRTRRSSCRASPTNLNGRQKPAKWHWAPSSGSTLIWDSASSRRTTARTTSTCISTRLAAVDSGLWTEASACVSKLATVPEVPRHST